MLKSHGLTLGTVTERIGDESMTRSDSAFVHRNMWQITRLPPPYAESSKRWFPPIRLMPLTFGRSRFRLWPRTPTRSADLQDLLRIPNTSLTRNIAF